MASTYTDLGTELMTTGENAGDWGTKTNTNLQIIEEAARGYVAVSASTVMSIKSARPDAKADPAAFMVSTTPPLLSPG